MFIWSCCVLHIILFIAHSSLFYLLHIHHSCMMWLDFATLYQMEKYCKTKQCIYVFCSIGNSLKPINNCTCPMQYNDQEDNNVIMY
eukprot:UN08337